MHIWPLSRLSQAVYRINRQQDTVVLVISLLRSKSGQAHLTSCEVPKKNSEYLRGFKNMGGGAPERIRTSDP